MVILAHKRGYFIKMPDREIHREIFPTGRLEARPGDLPVATGRWQGCEGGVRENGKQPILLHGRADSEITLKISLHARGYTACYCVQAMGSVIEYRAG